jgi:hypothetical protein
MAFRSPVNHDKGHYRAQLAGESGNPLIRLDGYLEIHSRHLHG